MSLSFLDSLILRLTSRWPVLFYAATWTTLLTVTVAVASFSPEFAFVSAISPTSSFSAACEDVGTVRVPLDVPTEVLCLPSHLFKRSKLDFLVPPLFAAVIVAVSAYLVRAFALGEDDGAVEF